MVYQHPWYVNPRRRPYLWLRDWRSIAAITSTLQVALTRIIRVVARRDASTPLAARLALMQVSGAGVLAQPRGRLRRFADTSKHDTLLHHDTILAPLSPTFKLS